MRFFCALLFFLLACPLFGETIGYVEYHLPQTEHGWKLSTSKGDKNSAVRLYVPDNMTPGDQVREHFAVTYNKKLTTTFDIQTLTTVLKSQFPNEDVKVSTVETDPESVIYEWSVTTGGTEKAHGWFRIFSTQKGIVSLGYVTQDPKNIEKARAYWLPALRGAKIMS